MITTTAMTTAMNAQGMETIITLTMMENLNADDRNAV